MRVAWGKKEPFSPGEQAAAREVNRSRVGRLARIQGRVETVVRELTPEEIQKGYDAAAKAGTRIDKHAAYFDWKNMIQGFSTVPANPVGHFIEFCKKRAREVA